jgi:hypothetical protein
VAITWPFRPALNVTEPSDFMVTATFRFSPGREPVARPEGLPVG